MGAGDFVMAGHYVYLFSAVTIRQDKPAIAEGINGAWLIVAVATHSISILGTLLSPHIGRGQEWFCFLHYVCIFRLYAVSQHYYVNFLPLYVCKA